MAGGGGASRARVRPRSPLERQLDPKPRRPWGDGRAAELLLVRRACYTIEGRSVGSFLHVPACTYLCMY